MQHSFSPTLSCNLADVECERGREGGCCRRFPPDIHHFSPTYSCYHRDGDYSIAGITETACRALSYQRLIQLTDFLFPEGAVICDVNDAQKGLSPAAVTGLKPVNLAEGARSGQPQLLGAGCCCTANRISRPTWRHFFFAAFTMI